MSVSDASIKHAKEKPECPYCKTPLSFCATPPMHVGDGLGWGTDVFFICLNDDCSLFVNGWAHIETQYGKMGSYRYMLLPGDEKGSPMMVGSKIAFTGSELSIDELEGKNERYLKEKESLRQLESCVEDKNLDPVLYLITDEEANLVGRRQACDLLVELSDIRCIDPIRNHTFRHQEIGQLANLAIARILKKNFQKECPNCAEIIKSHAKVCKHCGK